MHNIVEAKLDHGDTLVIPSGSHCMSAGVYATRLAHATIDLMGKLIFPQTPRTWPNKTDGGYVHAILITGATNLTITSSSKSGLIRAKGCLEWYRKSVWKSWLTESGHFNIVVPIIDVRLRKIM